MDKPSVKDQLKNMKEQSEKRLNRIENDPVRVAKKKKKREKREKIILLLFISVLLMMLFFPITYTEYHPGSGFYVYGFKYVFLISFILDSAQYNIHTGLYMVQITLVTLIFAGISYLNKKY